MDEAIKKAEYAVSNLDVLAYSVSTYASYARSLCEKADVNMELYAKVEEAEKAIVNLSDLIKSIL